MKRVAIIIGLIMTSFASHAVTVPMDSVSEDMVYELMLTDYDEALRLMNTLRLSGDIPAYRLDITEGDLYFNNGKYYQALKFYTRALESEELRSNDTLYMEHLHRLISSYDGVHNDVKKVSYIKLLLEKARACGSQSMESIALFNMGKTIYLQENRSEGYDLMFQATELMERCDYRYKYDNLRYNYNTLILYCLRDGRYTEGLRILEKAEILGNTDGSDVRQMEGVELREQKIHLAYRTVLLHHLGNEEGAEAAYRKFLSVQPDNHTHDYLVMPYLYSCGRYDEVIDMNRVREMHYRANGDTVNYQMLTIKRSLANAYYQSHRPDSAAIYYKELAQLTDMLKKDEQQSAALELATLYETAEKDRLLIEQGNRLQTSRLLVLFLCIILSISIAFIVYALYMGRRIRRKNRVLVQESIELIKNKQLYLNQRHDYFNLLEKTPLNQNDKPVLSDPVLTPEELALWNRIENDIIIQKLYLDPTFSRDTLIARYGISKNQLTRLFRHKTTDGMVRYIRNLRLDYAVSLMKENPQYSIKAIAIDCGISSSSTFYRLFQERFGMTPLEYQKTLSESKITS